MSKSILDVVGELRSVFLRKDIRTDRMVISLPESEFRAMYISIALESPIMFMTYGKGTPYEPLRSDARYSEFKYMGITFKKAKQ